MVRALAWLAAFSVASGAHAVDFTLTVTKLGGGAGTVTSSPPGISCGTGVAVQHCSQGFPSGTSVTLSAPVIQPNIFGGWTSTTGSCSGTGPCTFTLTQNTSVSALFNVLKFRVRYQALGEAPVGQSPGSIKVAGHNCLATTPQVPTPPCEQEIIAFTTVSVEAIPGGTTQIKNFSPPCTPVNGKCSFQLLQEVFLSATFEPRPVASLTIGTLGNANGKVRADSLTQGVIPNISCSRVDKDTVGNCSSTMPTGTVIKLTATPEKNLITQPLPDFKGWFDGTGAAAACNGKTTTTCQFTLSANSSVKAKFCRAVVGCLTQ